MSGVRVLVVASGPGVTDSDLEVLRLPQVARLAALSILPDVDEDDEPDVDDGEAVTDAAAPPADAEAPDAEPVAAPLAAPPVPVVPAAEPASPSAGGTTEAPRAAGPITVPVVVRRPTMRTRLARLVRRERPQPQTRPRRRRRLPPDLRAAERELMAALESDPVDLLVSLDARADLLVWRACRRDPAVVGVSGLDTAERYLGLGGVDLSPRATLANSVDSILTALPDRAGAPDRTAVVARGLADAVPDQAAYAGGQLVVVTDGEPAVELRGDVVVVRTGDEDLEPAAEPGLRSVLRAASVRTSLPELAVPSAGRAARLLIAPANYAGQGAAWARALGAAGRAAENLAIVSATSAFQFPADVALSREDWADPVVRARGVLEAVVPASHVLLEAMRPVVGAGSPIDVDPWDVDAGARDVEAILASGRQVALLVHGSEGRTPARHRELYPTSPFSASRFAHETAVRERQTALVHAHLQRLGVPVLVSTPDMLDFLPDATLLPVALGSRAFVPGRPLLSRRRPVVLHAPTSGPFKGSEYVDPVLRKLDARGHIEYRRLEALPPSLVPSVLRDVDVVVDQVVLGNPGVLAAQAMAAGRVVVAHLPERVRERMGGDVPVVEAVPATLSKVVRRLVADADRMAALGAAGAAFARQQHDGRASARVLGAWLDATS